MMNRAARLERYRAIGAFLVGLTIPISVSISEIVTGLAFLILLFEWQPREAWQRLRGNPVAWASLALFLLLGLGTLYSVAPLGEATRIWIKYRELLYLPLFMLLCRDSRAARAGLLGFLSAMVLLLVLGFYQRFTGASFSHLRNFNGSIFGSYITEGVMVALGAYYFAVEAIDNRRWRVYAAMASALALAFVLFVSPGRTGYVVIVALALLFLFQTAPRKFWLPGCLVVILAIGTLYFVSPELHARMAGIGASLRGENSDAASASAGIRLKFYRGSLMTIAQHPILGTGTGSFNYAYNEVATAANLPNTTNPHNEYLMIGVQTGIVGILALLALLAALWFQAGRLATADSWRGRAVVLALAIGCLFNSFLLDHVDGQSFAFQAGLFFLGTRGREDQRHHHDL